VYLEDEGVEVVFGEDDADLFLYFVLAGFLEVGGGDGDLSARLQRVDVFREGLLRGDHGGHVLLEDLAHFLDRQVFRDVEVDAAADVHVELPQLVRRLDHFRAPRRAFCGRRLVVLDGFFEVFFRDAEFLKDVALELGQLLLEVLD